MLQAQSVTIKTDRTRILIGERVQVDLTVSLPYAGYHIGFTFPDSIPHFEVIENKDFDSSMSNGTYTINKKMIFTSFDSGSWHIPAFKFRLEQNKLSKIFSTDSVRIDVGYAASDSTNQLRDIKPILEVTVKDNRNMYIIAGIVLLIICIVLFYLYLKRRKPKTVPVFHNALSPFDEAMKALADLKQFDPGKPDQLKAYYSALTGIFKKYCSRKMDKNLMNKTTGDILISLNNKFNNPDLVSMLAIALRSADAVKFAKYVPDVSASDLSKEQIRSVIELMEKE